MRKRVGIVVAAFLYYSGLVGLARWWMQRSGPRVIILNYHQASGKGLRRHLLYLRRHYRMLHLDEALEELYQPESLSRGKKPHTALVLTFDDGYRDNYTQAFALARELQIPFTIFLIPGYVESGDYFWWKEGRRLVRRCALSEVTLDERTYYLSQSSERSLLAREIDQRLRHSTSVAQREEQLAYLRKLLAVSSSVVVEEENEQPLSWAQVRKMQESGLVSFGAHTMNHPVLSCLEDEAELRYEVSECRRVLEERLAVPIRTFAYPIGRTEHIGQNAVEAVQEAGYRWAVTTIHGVASPQSKPLLLGRVLGDVSRHWLVMAAETSGIWHLFAPLWKSVIGKGESA